ncbi:MAG: flagellin [Rhizobiales bacterium]|nr:flagellin [Hyphomicrobiales bacterium]
MSSLLTNASAMTALQTLSMVNKDLSTTQARISTGQKVATASDNAAYWSIATTMRSDNSALGTVQEALGLGAAKVDTAYAGMDQAIEYVKQIKDKLIAAQEPSADRAKLQGDISQLQDQLRGIAESASFSGENWLQADITAGGGSVGKSVVSSFVRDSSGNVSVKTINYTLDSSTVLFDTGGNTAILDKTSTIQGNSVTLNVNVAGVVSAQTVAAFSTDDVIAAGAGASVFNGEHANDGTADYVKVADDTWVIAVDQSTVATQEAQFDDGTTVWAIDLTSTAASTTSSVDTLTISSSTTSAQLDGMLQMVDDAMTSMTSAAASLGSISSRIDMQNDFISKLTDSLDRGIGRLVDADMEEESARLSALQVQQQLGIQALSIANSGSQNILSLFR